MKNKTLIAVCFITFFFSSSALSSKLVSPKTIAEQKKLTSVRKLKNGIPVVMRRIPNSDIVHMTVTFKKGIAHYPNGSKAVPNLTLGTMTMGSKSFPKEKVFALTEKFSIELGCSAGIETSSCSVGTLNDYWKEALPLFSSLLTEPSFTKTNIKLQKERQISSVRSTIQAPDKFINEVVNRIFYPKNHPYYQPAEASVQEIPKISRKTIVSTHASLLDASKMQITIASSMPAKKIIKDLNIAFGNLRSRKSPAPKFIDPAFDIANSTTFEHREIPTAYIRVKFNGLPKNHSDEHAVNLMINILDEELGNEIRTRRSLSYSVFAYMIQHSIGIGMISASTSKPKETLQAISAVVKKMKNTVLPAADLEEYKTQYVTSYLLTQETHGSLAEALSASFLHRGTTNYFYDYLNLFEKISAKDVQRLAQKLLRNFRVGVIYDKKKFKDEWSKKLVEASSGRKSKS